MKSPPHLTPQRKYFPKEVEDSLVSKLSMSSAANPAVDTGGVPLCADEMDVAPPAQEGAVGPHSGRGGGSSSEEGALQDATGAPHQGQTDGRS